MIKSPSATRAALALLAAVSLTLGACSKSEPPPPSTTAAPPATAGTPAPSPAPQEPAQDLLADARPLASTTASDAKLDSVLTGGNSWRSEKQGTAANGEFVGFELPEGKTLQPRELTVRWVAWHWVPRNLVVEHSDDGKAWTEAASFPVKEPSDVQSRMNGANRWEETFSLPATAGAHRFWRLRAKDMPDGNFFGLERIAAR